MINCKGTVDFKHFLYQLNYRKYIGLDFVINVLEIGNEVGGNCDES